MKVMVALILSTLMVHAAAQTICSPASNTFTTKVNFSEGQLGYFEYEECEGVNPILGVKLGVTYTFVQADPSNWFHPMGFAYGADGALDDQPELEPGEASPSSNSTCSAGLTCPRPMYYKDTTFLGVGGTDNFGLDDYEPLFFYPLLEWTEQGAFSIQLNYDDAYVGQDFFYFCHIHQFMSGRIKVLDAAGLPIVASDTPSIPYAYDEPGEFDRACNTFGLDAWQLPNDLCPDRFVCDIQEVSAEHAQFAECIESMNCAMVAGMTTNVGLNEVALFNYHMIPHHENAINMAKALLPKLPCDDLSNEDDTNCVMQVLVREIINGQNFQIQTMRAVNNMLGAPAQDNCDVPLKSTDCSAADRCGGLGLFARDRFRMHRQLAGSICVADCVPDGRVHHHTADGWECGDCE